MSENTKTKSNALQFIRTIYLSLAALIGLVVFVIGTVSAINLFMTKVVFPVDNSIEYYYTPYQKDGCESEIIYKDEGGTETISKTPEEIEKCRADMAENKKLNEKNAFNRDIAIAISFILVGLPIWLLHFMIMQKDWKRKED